MVQGAESHTRPPQARQDAPLPVAEPLSAEIIIVLEDRVASGVAGSSASVGGFHQGLHRDDAGAGAHGGGGYDRVVPPRPHGRGYRLPKFLEIAVALRALFRDQELKRLIELLGL